MNTGLKWLEFYDSLQPPSQTHTHTVQHGKWLDRWNAEDNNMTLCKALEARVLQYVFYRVCQKLLCTTDQHLVFSRRCLRIFIHLANPSKATVLNLIYSFYSVCVCISNSWPLLYHWDQLKPIASLYHMTWVLTQCWVKNKQTQWLGY